MWVHSVNSTNSDEIQWVFSLGFVAAAIIPVVVVVLALIWRLPILSRQRSASLIRTLITIIILVGSVWTIGALAARLAGRGA